MTTLNVGTSELLTVRVDPNTGSVLPDAAWCSLAVVPASTTPSEGDWQTPTSAAVSGSTLRLKLLWQATTAGRFALWLRVLSNPETLLDLVELIDVTAAGDQPWADVSDVTSLLGPLPLPAGLDVGTHLLRAHGQAVARLAVVYGEDLPALSGQALALVSQAEAALAAASVWLVLLRQQQAPDYTPVTTLRADADAVLARALPGFPVGASDDSDGSGPMVRVVRPAVASSSRGPYVDDDRGAAFVNPRTGQLVTGSWG